MVSMLSLPALQRGTPNELPRLPTKSVLSVGPISTISCLVADETRTKEPGETGVCRTWRRSAAKLGNENIAVRAEAAERLSRLAEEAQPAAVALVKATGDDESVSQWAVAALEELGPPPAGLAKELAALTAGEHELVAYWSITLLGRLGSAAASTTETLVAALESSPHLAAQQRAAWALGEIGVRSESVTEALRQASQATDPRLAKLAAQSLAKLG